MFKKKQIHLFFRKPFSGLHFSLENFYLELIKNFQHEDIEFKVKVCPLESRGILNRILITIWAFLNQGDVNHICGDVNFITFFLNKKKTINTILDHASLIRLKGIKRFIYYLLWVKIPVFKSAHIITISNKTKKEILKYSMVNKNKITVSGVCIDSIYKKKVKPFLQRKPKILIIGTSDNKNIKNILMSLTDIDCELIIIGDLTKEYFLILKKFKIKYKNYVALKNKTIYKKYVESDLLLFPSQYEGFGMPILEAQTVGRVVITSNLEPMISVGGNGALYVNPYNVKNINNVIKKVINNKNLRNKLIQNGFKNIKRFNKREILKKHLNCYYNILNDNF
tara:strand:+ start:657 stop:1670 length:1014 start_codon:yes stop_codon:yes gene_type:complete